MSAKRQSVKIINPSLDEVGGEIVIRGVIDNDSLSLLNIDDYQREILGGNSVQELKDASVAGQLPDIDLGMRGENFRITEGDAFAYLQDDVYIIDGLQRVTAAKEVMKEDSTPRLGVCVRFNTTYDSEKARFEKLNSTQRSVSANVLLRNMTDSSPAMKMLFALSQDKEFALYQRVSWGQTAKKAELVNARTFLLYAVKIHQRFNQGSAVGGNFKVLASSMDKAVKRVGKNKARANVFEFFSIVDSVWNISSIRYKKGAVFMRLSFLAALALVFTRHPVFWKDERLHVDGPTRKKLASFAISDPSIKDLSNAGDSGTKILYELLVDHINHGKRTRRLQSDI